MQQAMLGICHSLLSNNFILRYNAVALNEQRWF